MRDFSYHPDISRSLLGGVFSGMVATVICLVYSVFYERATNFVAVSVNVSTIIFAVLILFVFSASVYHLLCVQLKLPTVVYILLYAAITFYCMLQTADIQSTDNPLSAKDLKGLLFGIELICGSL